MRVLEKVVLLSFLVLLGVPGILGLALNGDLSPRWKWLRSGALQGARHELKAASLTRKNWFHTAFQDYATARANDTFFGRELLIRSLNEVLYRGFGKSYMSNEAIIIGKRHDLFESDYLAYFGHFAPAAPDGFLEQLTDGIALLRQRFRSLGSEVIVVITPSKTTLYPEDVPDRFRTRLGKDTPTLVPTGYRRLIQLLQQKRVPLVDGRALSLERVHDLPVRGFPKTGTHWTYSLACFTAQALLNELGTLKGARYPLIEQRNPRIDHSPEWVEADLFYLLNLLERPRDRYLHVDFCRRDTSPEGRLGSLTFVGGSFTHEIIEVLERAKAVRQIAYYNYFDVFVEHWPAQSLIQRPDIAQIPWDHDFRRTDAVVLEMNESVIENPEHVGRFIKAASEFLDPPQARLSIPPDANACTPVVLLRAGQKQVNESRKFPTK
ncbi:MAG TPA: hypothetical protein VGD78_01900 [Chthoniobacterales bacterium]